MSSLRRNLATGAIRVAMLALTAGVVIGCLYSPPGQLPSSVRILYSKTVSDSLDSFTGIYFVVARAGNELQLTGDGVDRQPVFAPRLRRVFFTHEKEDGRLEIHSMELDGSQSEVVLNSEDGDYADPAVSPDEERVAYTYTGLGRSPEVRVATVDGFEDRAVATGGGSWREPAWSPDGSLLVVVGMQRGVARLFVVDPDGGEPREIATAEAGQQTQPDWSPDGEKIVFSLGSGSDSEVAVVDVETGAVTRLTDNQTNDSSPRWSPGGERIIFVSRRERGKENLWLMDLDGSNPRALTRSKEYDARDPDWI